MAAKDEAATVRLRNISSGAIVSVASEKASRMGAEWEPASKSAKKSSSND